MEIIRPTVETFDGAHFGTLAHPHQRWVKLSFEELTLRTKLRSSRGGSFWWAVSKKANPLLNNAPYEPTIHALLKGVTMVYGHTVKDTSCPIPFARESVADVPAADIVQCDHPYKWLIRFDSAQDLSGREARKAFHDAFIEGQYQPVIGALEACTVSLKEGVTPYQPEEGAVEWMSPLSPIPTGILQPHEARLFNHTIVPSKYYYGAGDTDFGDVAVPVAVPLDNAVIVFANSITVYSTDHETVVVNPKGQGVKFRHPFPTRDRGVD